MMSFSILLAAVLGFIWGAVWYMSPVGKLWREAKLTDPNIDSSKYISSKKYMLQMFALGFALTFFTAYVLHVVLLLVQVETLFDYLHISMLVCFGFIITTKFTDMAYTNTPPFWGKKAQTVFLVDSAYYIVLFAIFGAVFYFL